MPSPEKSTYRAITRLPAGESFDAYAALRRKSLSPTAMPSARNATLTPRPTKPSVALALASLMLASASGSSWGCALVPQDAGAGRVRCATVVVPADLGASVGTTGPGIAASGSTAATRGLCASAAACEPVSETDRVSGTVVRASTVLPRPVASDVTTDCALRALTPLRPCPVPAAGGRRKTSIV